MLDQDSAGFHQETLEAEDAIFAALDDEFGSLDVRVKETGVRIGEVAVNVALGKMNGDAVKHMVRRGLLVLEGRADAILPDGATPTKQHNALVRNEWDGAHDHVPDRPDIPMQHSHPGLPAAYHSHTATNPTGLHRHRPGDPWDGGHGTIEGHGLSNQRGTHSHDVPKDEYGIAIPKEQ